jgi:hybrid cluster-associated redox disulfide protein
MITKEMKIEDVLRNCPKTIPVFSRFGIDCAECQLSAYENVEHGARVHGIDLNTLLEALNAAEANQAS